MKNKLTQFTIHNFKYSTNNSPLTNFAFTLAETLIVMGIIGVVAALTLPNLNSATGDKEKIAKVKKIYSNLEDAMGRAQAVYGPISEWTNITIGGDGKKVTLNPLAVERITEFMKLSKTCALVANQGCFNQSLNNANGTNFGIIDGAVGYYKFILADGSSVALNYSAKNNDFELNFYVDIDGPNKGSSTLGKDVFVFNVSTSTDYLVPNTSANFSAYLSELKSKGMTAAGWIIDYDNMDYLKFDSSGKCPNNVTVNETNPSCK